MVRGVIYELKTVMQPRQQRRAWPIRFIWRERNSPAGARNPASRHVLVPCLPGIMRSIWSARRDPHPVRLSIQGGPT